MQVNNKQTECGIFAPMTQSSAHSPAKMCGLSKIVLLATLSTFTLLLQQSALFPRLVGVQAVPASTVTQRDAIPGNSYPVVYTRKVRRRPPQFPDDEYVEEILETFNLQHGPPRRIYTNDLDDGDDEEIDRMIRCDFDPTLSECELLRKPLRRRRKRPKATRPRSEVTTTQRTKDENVTTKTTATITTTTARSTPLWPWATTAATTATTLTTTPRYTFVDWWTTTTTSQTPKSRTTTTTTTASPRTTTTTTTTPVPPTTTTTTTPAPQTTTTTTTIPAPRTTTTTTTPAPRTTTTKTPPLIATSTTTEYLPFLPVIPDWTVQEVPEFVDSTTSHTETSTPSNSAEPTYDDEFPPVVGDIDETANDDYLDEYNNHGYNEEEEEVDEDYIDAEEEQGAEQDKGENNDYNDEN